MGEENDKLKKKRKKNDVFRLRERKKLQSLTLIVIKK